jgi:hypothetical protein
MMAEMRAYVRTAEIVLPCPISDRAIFRIAETDEATYVGPSGIAYLPVETR